MDWRWGWWLVLWIAQIAQITQASAQGVHKCIAPGGAVIYQSAPCEPHAREAANWEAPADRAPSRETSRQTSSQRERERERPAARAGNTRIVRNASKPSACEQAKANRDSTLERVGLKRTFDLLSRLDEQVRNACL